MLSVVIVLLNCVKQGMYDPCKGESPIQEVMDHLVFAYFVMEMVIKMIALGIFGHSRSYLSNNWHKFDVFIMFTEVLDYIVLAFGANFNISYAFTPMRLISREPSMREFVSILLGTATMLGNVLLLYIFVIHVFAVVGVQLWAGTLRHRCFLGQDIPTMYNVSLSPYFSNTYGEKTPFTCSLDGTSGMRHCKDVPPYRDDGMVCLLNPLVYNPVAPPVAGANNSTCFNWNVYYNVCLPDGPNPNKGALNFDNVGYAWITMFQVVTLEGWTTVMYYIMDVYSFWSFIFFILTTVVGSSVIMNVCAVVIATHFSGAMRRDTERQQGGAMSIKQLCCKLLNRLKQIILERHQKRSQVSDRQTERTASYILLWTTIHKKLEKIVNSKVFNGSIMFAIFLSILTMAVEFHGQFIFSSYSLPG
uniref:Ion transport domain-containing protein n=1 Tax=Amphiprion ocellaris TaxID=80972 RepID=A0A3Q1BP25_AMPOC